MNSTSISFPGRAPFTIKLRDDQQREREVVRQIGSAGLREALSLPDFATLEAAADALGVTPHKFLVDALGRLATERARPYSGWPRESSRLDIQSETLMKGAKVFLDPFAGRANFAHVAVRQRLRACYYCEISPVFQFIAEARGTILNFSADARAQFADRLEELADERWSREEKDELLEHTRALLPQVSDVRQADVEEALTLLSRIRTALQQRVRERPVAALAAAAVVEALPRTAGELIASSLQHAIARELGDAATFVRESPEIVARPQLLTEDARDLALLRPLDVDLVVSDPPSLNFASYANPIATWFLGTRRPASPPRESLDALKQRLRVSIGSGRDASWLLRRIETLARKTGESGSRMERFVVAYFAAMAQTIEALTPHLAKRATIALAVEGSTIQSVQIATDELLAEMLKLRGFEPVQSTASSFVVMRR